MNDRQRLGRIRINLERRALIFDSVRSFFRSEGFTEIETPLRVPAVAPESQIIPIESEGWYLSTSPELHMKRLLAAGYDRIFQILRCFRKGERGRWHNPEFTLLEWYRTGADHLTMIADTERLLGAVAGSLNMGPVLTYQGHRIDLSPPWPRLPIRSLFRKIAGWDPVAVNDPVRFDTDLVTRVIPALPPGRPAVLTDYPAPMASLARLSPTDPAVAERAEVFIGGLEIANAFSELTDPEEQRRRFRGENEEIRRQGRCPPPNATRFLEALPHLPPSGGIALGMDRLAMLFCDAGSIDEVTAFPEDWA